MRSLLLTVPILYAPPLFTAQSTTNHSDRFPKFSPVQKGIRRLSSSLIRPSNTSAPKVSCSTMLPMPSSISLLMPTKRIASSALLDAVRRLPTNTHTYNYKSPKTVNIGGLDFCRCGGAKFDGNLGRHSSDGARAAPLAAKGFKMLGTEFLSQGSCI